MIRKDTMKMLESWSLEFEAISERVRYLIGGAHWLSDGKHKESILRNFLMKYAPERYIYSSGFIVSHDGGSPSSGEIDILIVSPDSGIPWFRDSDILITPPENVIAHIHVKSSYRKEALSEIFESSIKASKAIAKGGGASSGYLDRTWSAGFFFSHNNPANPSVLRKNMEELIRKAEDARYLPDAIYISHDMAAIIYKKGKAEVEVKILKARRLAVPLFLCHFFESLDSANSTEVGDLLYSQEAEECVSFVVSVGG